MGGTLSYGNITIVITHCMYINGNILTIVFIIVAPSFGVSVGHQQCVNIIYINLIVIHANNNMSHICIMTISMDKIMRMAVLVS